ncbi:substrate-binding domain-containing protein [Kibdelosporangium philippinense]|uniref:Substrate-binding domain-containing protein n=1 Tax=Kibdelosporangium philippinense TaxID=211113 RepID=A0ABS8ZT11_9PSEU|nr:VWA domain-containing protein [Kibdelosporangium philippinense]MCE7010850.1 substrate-binding domain-containing protein [Kibdelosporangium philippinense]
MLLVLAACTPSTGDQVRLTVLATSELADLGPVLADLKRDTGVELVLDYRGTVAASSELAKGPSGFDLAWLSTNRFLRLRGAQPLLSESTMMSPLVLGVKKSKAGQLGEQPSWADIADRAALGELTFGMSDPRVSGDGMAALIGVATAAAGTGAAVRQEDVRCDRIQGFLAGRAFDAPDVIEEYERRQDNVDAVVAHESAILSLSGRLREPLEVVYPRDGIVLSDYPLMLLNQEKRAHYDRVVEWLRSPAAQQAIMARTSRRPIDPALPRNEKLDTPIGNALYFPGRQEVLDTLLAAYDRAGTGRQVIFVLDYSKSMAGGRIAGLREAFAALNGFDRFYVGETVTIIRFAGQVLEERSFTVSGKRELDALQAVVASDDMGSYTAIWSALDHAYRKAGDNASIVLMTDGENNAGTSLAEFLKVKRVRVPTFAIRFGEADLGELSQVSAATGGRVVDATAKSLLEAVREIRGCR